MSAAIALDRRQWERLQLTDKAHEVKRVSTLQEVTMLVEAVTETIKSHWKEASPDTQHSFRLLLRGVREPPPLGFRHRLKYAWLCLRAGPETVKKFHVACERFIATLGEIVEREQAIFESNVARPDHVAAVNAAYDQVSIPLEGALKEFEQG